MSGITVALFISPKETYGFLFDVGDNLVTPCLRKLDPEVSHRLSVAFTRSIWRLKVFDELAF